LPEDFLNTKQHKGGGKEKKEGAGVAFPSARKGGKRGSRSNFQREGREKRKEEVAFSCDITTGKKGGKKKKKDTTPTPIEERKKECYSL